MANRRKRREKGKAKSAPVEQPRKQRVLSFSWYDRNYRKLLIIPLILLVLAFIQIGFQYGTTGDFLNKGITLKGGVSVVVTQPIDDIDALRADLDAKFSNYEIDARELTDRGTKIGVIVESDVDTIEGKDALVDEVKTFFPGISDDDVTVESTGGDLGADFFRAIITALIIAFVFMAIVVFILFRTWVPSIAVIFAAFVDIIITLSIVNLMGVKLSSAGIAAFLMLVGYSVDTDILLTNRVIKRDIGSVNERLFGAAKTGLTMSVTTLAAVTIAFFVTDSAIINQIMLILIIGLCIDIIATYFFNAGVLKWYMERGEKR